MVLNKCELEWVLNGDEGECIEEVNYEEGEMAMVSLRKWVMAMDERETTLKWVTEKYEIGS